MLPFDEKISRCRSLGNLTVYLEMCAFHSIALGSSFIRVSGAQVTLHDGHNIIAQARARLRPDRRAWLLPDWRARLLPDWRAQLLPDWRAQLLPDWRDECDDW